MKELNNQELQEIKGGINLTGSLLGHINELIKILLDAGKYLGSAIRRIGSDAICPLE